MAALLDGSMAESKAMAPRFEGSRAEAEAEAMAMAMARRRAMLKAHARARARAMAKVKKTPWAEYRAIEKRLDSMENRIGDLNWRLNLEKVRGFFGDLAFESLFPPEIRDFRGETEQMVAMSNALEAVYQIQKRQRLLPLSGEAVSKRLRKQEDTLSEEEEEDDFWKPSPNVKDLKEELSRLECQYQLLLSEKGIPDFSGMTEADRAAEAERLRQEALEEATRLSAEGDVLASVSFLDFDPKQGGIYYNRNICCADLATFDLEEESPIGPMRFTNKVFKEKEIQLHDAVNILSVKVACSDVGFPIQVYGTVVARDSTDYKRVYLFRRDREDCQLINSKDEPLMLTGPKRGLLLLDANYVETDLMIKDHQGQDRELSKGFLRINGAHVEEKCEIERDSLATRLSTVKVSYAVVVSALEATISMEVLEGEFYGIVAAHTTSVKNWLVLYDSQLSDYMPGNGRGAIKMTRPVISVYCKDKLIIAVRVHGGKGTRFKFTPRTSSGDEIEFTLGAAKMRLRADWSILDRSDAAEH